ncbi:MAG: FAD-dependent oxidoreductase [Saprospiraceae bacterium]|nr:FAD-dependent oxidoreductase [Saprospiraceae bacterium]
MGEYRKPENQEDLNTNFEQIHPLMDATMAYYASARCLYCYDAPCIEACPSGIDIPLFIRQIRTGNLPGAARTIYNSNYFGHICGKVCPTEVLCEGACVYTEQDVEPVEIGALQTYACDHAIRHDIRLYDLPEANGKNVAVIGAGPTGIACACELRLLGYDVDVFEAKAHPSGLALHGTAPYKITNEEVLDEVAWLQRQFGFRTHYGKRITPPDLRKMESEYDAIFLGIGLGHTRMPPVEGTDLPGCEGAITFIERVKLDPLSAYPGDRVVVVGGGNTAMDAASESARLGARSVTLVYRRSRAEMNAYDFEYDLVKQAGVEPLFHYTPLRILGEDKVTGVELARTHIVDGKLSVMDDQRMTIPCDAVIMATGQSKQTGYFADLDIHVDSKGRIVVNALGQTSNQKYFAGGDAVNGGAEVVNAAAEGKIAARGIHASLAEAE